MQQIVNLNREGMHIDVSVRTIIGALATTNAPILNNHFKRIAATNRSHGTTDHTQGIAALAAGGCNQIAIEAKTFPN